MQGIHRLTKVYVGGVLLLSLLDAKLQLNAYINFYTHNRDHSYQVPCRSDQVVMKSADKEMAF